MSTPAQAPPAITDRVLALGRAAWPDVALDRELLAAYLGPRIAAGLAVEELEAAVVPADLYLACACVAGQPSAIAAFERTHMPAVRAAVASLDRGRGLTAEVEQQIRTLLLVDDAGRGPALAHYAGRGALRRFVRVVAVREAWRLRKPEKREVGVDDQDLLDALSPPGDPALSAIKREAAEKVRIAFLAAMADLPRRERGALRMNFIDGLSIDEIAPVFRVHRATVARWIAAARDSLLAGTRKRLVKDLGLHASEVDSILRLAQSRIDLSLEGQDLSSNDLLLKGD